MKILVLTAYYPPYHSGGYELRCKNVLEQLTSRGHVIEVITNKISGKIIPVTSEANIYRRFHLLDSSKNRVERVIRDFVDVKFLHKRINSFKPDLVYLWHIVDFTRAIFPYLANLNMPIIYDEGGSGLSNCWAHGGSWYAFLAQKSESKLKNKLKIVAGKLVSRLSSNLLKNEWNWPENIRVYFNSELNYKNTLSKGVPVESASVIYSGVDIEKFSFKSKRKINLPIRIIVPGRIESKKGQADAILLLSHLCEKGLEANLTIVGKNNSVTYYQEIIGMIVELGLENQTRVLPIIDHDMLVHLYQESDICFFSSYQQYGLSRIPLEAMACGCLVITYGNEGSSEIIQDKKNGFIVDQSDFKTMSGIIQDLISDPGTFQWIIMNARQLIEEKHSMEAYIDKIEKILVDAKGSLL